MSFNLERHIDVDGILPTFVNKSSGPTPQQLPSIPTISKPLSIPIIPKIPELSSIFFYHRRNFFILSPSSFFTIRRSLIVNTGRCLSQEENFTKLSSKNIIPTSSSDCWYSTQVNNPPNCLSQSWNNNNTLPDQDMIDIFHTTPAPSGHNQTTFRGEDHPHRVPY